MLGHLTLARAALGSGKVDPVKYVKFMTRLRAAIRRLFGR